MPRTEAGKYVVTKAIWNEGMRGHFIRMFSTTGPDDIAIMVRKIEAEAVTAERARITAAVEEAIEAAGGRCIVPLDPEDLICEKHSEILFDGECEDSTSMLAAILAIVNRTNTDA